MNILLQLLQFFKTWGFLIAVFSFLFSLFNFILGKMVSHKIIEYDLKTIKKDIKNLETKTDNNNGRISKTEKQIGIRKAICDERHSKDK